MPTSSAGDGLTPCTNNNYDNKVTYSFVDVGLNFFLDVAELKSHLVVPDSFTSHLFPLDVEDSPDGAMVEPTDRTCREAYLLHAIVRRIRYVGETRLPPAPHS